MRSWLTYFAAVAILGVAHVAHAQTLLVHVAPTGDDSWSGGLETPNADRTDGPLASLTAARDAVRRLKTTATNPIEVVIHSGRYRLDSTMSFGPEDSGSADAPITWRAAGDAEVVITGALPVTNFTPVADDVRERLDSAARDSVVQADLGALGITEFGSPEGRGLAVVFRDESMQLARWPNEGFVAIKEVVGDTPIDVRGTKGFKEGRWIYEGDRPSRWVDEKDPWVHGYWFWDWSDQRQRVERIDPDAKVMEVSKPYHSYGYRAGQWYYAYNLLSEIDRPGEWYLDREDGILYFWPPDTPQPGDTYVTVQDELLSISDASYLTFQGLRFEGARRRAITINGGDSVVIHGSTFAHIGDDAVHVSDGLNHLVRDSTFYHLGGGAVSLRGGDRATLTPARHAAVNNHIHDYGEWYRMYKKAISLDGVGLRAVHNDIHDAPHMAIGFSGNDHLIEFNLIHDVCLESNDAGAIYAGRDWTMRGTKIRHNYFYNIRGFRDKGAVGVYLDDMFCGTEITGNVFYRVTRAAFIGGGRDVTIANNLFVDCDPAVHVDARAMNWASYHVDTTMTDRLRKMPYTSELWKTRYPQLVNILDDEPAAPKGNRVERNIAIGGSWIENYKPAPDYVVPENNIILPVKSNNPLFDRLAEDHDAAEDFQTVLDTVTHPDGFEPIPLREIRH